MGLFSRRQSSSGTDVRRMAMYIESRQNGHSATTAARVTLAVMPLHDDHRPVSREFEDGARGIAKVFAKDADIRSTPTEKLDRLALDALVALKASAGPPSNTDPLSVTTRATPG